MIDCKITENYFKERARMFENTKYYDCEPKTYGRIAPNTTEDIQKCINAVQAWSDAHPPKTYLSDFLEKYPNASINNAGYPGMCPFDLGYTQESECPIINGTSNCIKCWNRPL